MESINRRSSRAPARRALLLLAAFVSLSLAAETFPAGTSVTSQTSPLTPGSEDAARAFEQGLACYKSADWADAASFLALAAASPEYDTDSVRYMIITSQVYSKDFTSAVISCDGFLSDFPESALRCAVEYQKGHALYLAGEADRAVLTLSDFCSAYPESPMYSSALFWIAECFYDDNDYETAGRLYSRIVDEFPESEKYDAAVLKLSILALHEREQKLLYILRLTGEEYLGMRERYERELRTAQTEDEVELRRQLNAANERIRLLEREAAENAMQGGAADAASSGKKSGDAIYVLEQKADLVRGALNGEDGGGQ